MWVETSDLSAEMQSFATSLILLMTHPTFKSALWRLMTHEERLRLYALYQQTCYGDAPIKYEAASGASLGTTMSFPASKRGNQTQLEDESPIKSSVSQAEHMTTPTSSSFLNWLNVSARLRYWRWAELRGRMTPAVAAEAFCAEILALMARYKAFLLVPLVESALIRANYEAISSSQQIRTNGSSMGKKTFSIRQFYSKATQRLIPCTPATSSPLPSPPILFCVHAFEQDPAAMTMMWLCRAHKIPYEITFEPFPKSRTWSVRGILSSFLNRQTGTCDSYLPKSLSDDHKDGDILPFCCGVRFGSIFYPIFSPEAGFQLLFNVFLSNMPHWGKFFAMNLSLSSSKKDSNAHHGQALTASPSLLSTTSGPSSQVLNPTASPPHFSSSTLSHDNVQAVVQESVQRCAWMNVLQLITDHLRGPIMKLIMDPSVQGSNQDMAPDKFTGFSSPTKESSTGREAGNSWIYAGALSSSGAAKLSRRELFRSTAKHFHCFERLFLQSVMTQHGQNTMGVAPEAVLSDTRTAINTVLRYFNINTKKQRRLVSITDAYIASCAYLLCTSTFTQDVFPTLIPASLTVQSIDRMSSVPDRGGMVSVGQETASVAVPGATLQSSRRSSSLANDPNSAVRRLSTSAETPISLPGASSSCSGLLNRVVQEEGRAAQHRLSSTHLFRLTSNPHTGQGGYGDDDDLDITPARRGIFSSILPHRIAYAYATAAEGIERLIFTRLRSCHSAELDPSDPVNGALSPFLVLAHILSQSWRISQEQCVGFPYLMLDPKRRISFIMEFLEQEASADRRTRGQLAGGNEPAPPLEKNSEPQPSLLGAEKRSLPPANNTARKSKSGFGGTLQNAWNTLVRISTDNNCTEDGGAPPMECNRMYSNRTIIESKI